MRKYWLLAGLALFLAAPSAAQTPIGPVPSAQANPAPANTQIPSGLGFSSIYTASTVNDFLADCRSDQSGCMNKVGNSFLKHMNDTDDTICLNDVNYGKPVPNWLAAHTETHTMPTENGIYLALQRLYPCNKQ